jgi:PAS domain S-box-containing protein
VAAHDRDAHTSGTTPLPATVLGQALEAAPDGVVVVDDAGRIVYANAATEAVFGYPLGDLAGRPVEMLLPEELRGGHAAQRHEYTSNPRARPMGTGLELRGRRADGSPVPVEISLSPVPGTDPPLVVAIVRDVTEQREASAALVRAQEALSLVEDRERIARDLHDTVIQRLFAVGLALQGALLRTLDPDLVARVEESIEQIDETIRDIRTAIFSLHSRRAPTAGPRDAVLTITQEAARALGFTPNVQFEGLVDTAMPPDVWTELEPTLREALSNIAKHARATQVHVLLTIDDGVCLRVADNGVGITMRPAGGHGLDNMGERAKLLGGSCEVGHVDGGGTIIEWRVPLRNTGP